ncbi:MAG TPA: fimbria/pilus periplasmic chaperone [Solimonas sp.]|nr:fimbria/pilus periplasmic chaperone [Solimonas sp.]
MPRLFKLCCGGLAVLASLLAAMPATAAGLSVTPISLELTTAVPAQALWLSNTGSDALSAQLRVFAWNQHEGRDQLLPSRDLVLSPPMLNLQPGQRQLVRVIRMAPVATGERSYRILVDELPDPARQQQGLHFVMQFSVPAFVDTAVAAVPQLQWRIGQEEGKPKLITDNQGARRAKVTDVELFDGQGRSLLQRPGLLGYVLAGASVRWPLKLDAATAAATEIQARIDGQSVRQKLRLAPGAR